jgi:transcriptional regulator with XRE-family HTH domain
MPTKAKYPNNLRHYRIKRHYTQQQVLKYLGHTGPSRLSAWENGHAQPTARHLAALAELYSVSLEKLLGKKSISKLRTKTVIAKVQEQKPPQAPETEPSIEDLVDQLAKIVVEVYLYQRDAKKI